MWTDAVRVMMVMVGCWVEDMKAGGSGRRRRRLTALTRPCPTIHGANTTSLCRLSGVARGGLAIQRDRPTVNGLAPTTSCSCFSLRRSKKRFYL